MMRLIQIILVITVASVFITQATPDWYSLGLIDRAVNCILADDTSMVLAGTDSGVSVRWNKTWYHIKMLPVKALERVSPGVVAAAAGNGSRSDGVYIGRNIIDGPPCYVFKVGAYITSPTALLASSALSASDPAVMHLYVGNGNSVATGVIINDSLSNLDPIGMPEFAFGVEMPYCSALHIFGNRLYAGGYDRSPMAGLSYLLYYFGDSLFTMRKMKTTAMTEGRFTSLLGSNTRVLAIADLDSGVFFYDPSLDNPWRRIDGPTSNPIVSLYAGKPYGAGGDTMLFAATKEGVFPYTLLERGPVWTKLGALSAEPLYITGMGSAGELLVGTVKGVYRYGNQGTGVSRTFGPTARTKAQGERMVYVSGFSSPRLAKRYTNPQGRSIGGKTSAQIKASGVVAPDIR